MKKQGSFVLVAMWSMVLSFALGLISPHRLVLASPAQHRFADDEDASDANGNLPPGYVRSINAFNNSVNNIQIKYYHP